ncbi:MAG: helix-turn-helix transcriptional regulator, partial [Mycobacteriales bacterium]
GALAAGELELCYGRFLRSVGERRAAAAHLRTACQLLAAVGAAPLAAASENELAACGVRPGTRAARSPLSLTAQETVVARLVASGLTNREAAARLYVSPKAVEFHLGNVFAKLGVSSRRQLRDRPELTGDGYAQEPEG